MYCPFSKKACRESNHPETGCSLWTTLSYNEDRVERCAFNWIPTLLIENRIAIDKLLKEEKKDDLLSE